MADNVEAAPNGTPVSASDLRAQILASIPKDEESEPAPKEAEPDEDVANEADEDESAPVETADSDEDTDAEDEDGDEDNDDDDEDEDVPVDPKTAKGLDVVRKAEKRSRERLQATIRAKESELSAREQKLEERSARVDKIEKLAARAKYDPGALFRELGITDPADLELAGHALYSEGPAGQADPKRKEHAGRILRDRERDDTIAQLKRENAETRELIERQRQEELADRAAAVYFDEMGEAATSKHPLVAHMLKVDPEDTRRALVVAYERVLKKTGSTPKPASVVAEYDRAERARLKRIGVDPDAIAKTKAAPAKGAATKTVAGKTAANSNGTPTKDQILASVPRDPAELD
jgi:hypothetical protein